ncbi:heavy-metal-associated domain-containing protein [Clostridium sp. CF012]|uniref:heavy-metal-associated domain-containing protein n=1 Tax=Clostridium sp. CF012 TaxID=2843319 RepID=UPI001C0B8343|nr:heavy metal-associated domain-containing protein [Clostridium sp. CF012]MBU3142484.1 heavy-metal-associated domain-containing protein [Clostridium sp. CF012]
MIKKILIEGMSCEHCVGHVKEALGELNGVTSVDVNLDAKTAVLEGTVDVNDEDIKATIDDVGYQVVGIEVL